MTPRRILMIASEFPPKANAGVYRSVRFARYLPELGWSVCVLTMDPQWYQPGTPTDEGLLARVPDSVEVVRAAAVYPLDWAGRLRRPFSRGAGARGPGARDGKASANGHGRGGGTHPADNRGLYQRVKDAVSLPLMTPDRHIGWIPFAVRAGRRLIRERGITVVYSSGPPWTNHLVGLRLKRATGRPWVADFRDPWIGSDFRPIRRGDTWAGRRHRRLERRVVETADRVIVNTPRSRDDLLARYGDGLADKLTVIPNGFDPADYADLDPPPAARRGGPRVVVAHAGSFYGKRNVDGLIDAVENLHRRGDLAPGSLEIRLIGALRPGRSHEEARVEAAGVEDVIKLTPRVGHDACLRQLAEADVLLLVQVGAPLSVPGKAYEYIALGKPVLALAHQGATTDLVEREGLGLWVAPDDVAAIEKSLVDLCRQFAAESRRPAISPDVRDRYDGRRLTEQFDAVLREACRNAQPVPA